MTLSDFPLPMMTNAEFAVLHSLATPKFRPVLEVAMYGGLRLSEQLELRWRDIDVSRSVIRVGRWGRLVPMPPEVISGLFSGRGCREVVKDDDRIWHNWSPRLIHRSWSGLFVKWALKHHAGVIAQPPMPTVPWSQIRQMTFFALRAAGACNDDLARWAGTSVELIEMRWGRETIH